ncbi:MAG: hypothetical protein H0Z37_10445 [Firmicutes bacterium]|nr:hypothetical protein [Bacillota bacterium]
MGAGDGLRRLARQLCGGAWAVILWLGLTGSALGAPSVEEVVANVSRASGQRPAVMGFRQELRLQVLVFTWDFYADVVRQGDDIRVTLHGAPGFLSPDVTASLLDVGEALEEFDVRLVEEQVNDDGDPLYVLEATRRHREGQGALGGQVWVNGRTWLVEEAVLEYPWGTLHVRQQFQQVDGYTVLKEQHATASRLGARLWVQYRDYWFGNVATNAREDH